MTMQVTSQVARLLREQNLTIACAESCTGGMLMHELTNIPGSSAYMLGGIVAYSNTAKHSLLGVQENTLNVFGAVSEQVSAAMARGVRAAFGANIAIGITGIAGPDGGTPDKPVGLTYISYVTADMTVVRRYVWDGDRFANKAASVQAALKLILEQLGDDNF
ncbi:MAG: competence protein ComA [Phototrophicales bacterium]|nr:MAG: competence protein ComA [Phototrophicales bacterium]